MDGTQRQDVKRHARALIELDKLADRFHPRFLPQFAAAILQREKAWARAKDAERQVN